MTSITDDLRAARQLRDEGQEAVIAADTAAHRMHGELIREVINACASNGGIDFTCDDVRWGAMVHAHLMGHDFTPAPNLLPSLMAHAVKSGQIVRVADAQSTRRSARARRVGRYIGARYAPTT